jgi:hypothetical protein
MIFMIASLWVVATQVKASLTIFELSSVTSSTHQVGRKARLKQHCIQSFIQVSQLCRVRARASSGRREESKDVGRE